MKDKILQMVTDVNKHVGGDRISGIVEILAVIRNDGPKDTTSL